MVRVHRLIEAPSLTDLRERARTIAAESRACADETEQNRRVSAEMTARIRDAGLYRLLQPKSFGGDEREFGALIDIASDLAEGCASTAWCFAVAAAHQWILGCFGPEAQSDAWSANPDAVACGSYAPVGKTEAVDGGFLLEGRWSFGSNCDNSEWFLAGAMLQLERPTPGFLLVPMADVEIVDVWRTVGLAGTGSQDLVIARKLFVPAHRVLSFADASSGSPPGVRAGGSHLYAAPFLSVVPLPIGAAAIGAARGALADFIDFTRDRVARGGVGGGGAKIADQQAMQMRIAEAAAALDAADLLMRRGISEVENLIQAGRSVPDKLRIANRRDQAYAVRLAVTAVNTVFEAVGGGGLMLDNPIQRAWRDVNAAAKHFGLSWDNGATTYGRYALGLDPGVNY